MRGIKTDRWFTGLCDSNYIQASICRQRFCHPLHLVVFLSFLFVFISRHRIYFTFVELVFSVLLDHKFKFKFFITLRFTICKQHKEQYIKHIPYKA